MEQEDGESRWSTSNLEVIVLCLTRQDYNKMALNICTHQFRARPFHPSDQNIRRRALKFLQDKTSAQRWNKVYQKAGSAVADIRERQNWLMELFEIGKDLHLPPQEMIRDARQLLAITTTSPAAQRALAIAKLSQNSKVLGEWDPQSGDFIPTISGHLYYWCGRGPVWSVGTAKAPDASCAFDSVIQICIFLNLGSTLIDRWTIAQIGGLTPVETFLLDAVQAPWGSELSLADQRQLKKVKERFQRGSIRAAMTQEGDKTSFKSVDNILETVAGIFGQTRVRLKTMLCCKICGKSWPETTEPFDEQFSFFQPCITEDMSQAIEQRLVSTDCRPLIRACPNCEYLPLQRVNTTVGHIPPRLAAHSILIDPSVNLEEGEEDWRYTEWMDSGGITVNFPIGPMGELVATHWRFIGGIWSNGHHFRVQFLDTDINVGERRFKIYDGHSPSGYKGCIVGGKGLTYDDDGGHVVHPSWIRQPAAVFWERVG